jgi:hypothetical protein
VRSLERDGALCPTASTPPGSQRMRQEISGRVRRAVHVGVVSPRRSSKRGQLLGPSFAISLHGVGSIKSVDERFRLRAWGGTLSRAKFPS